jgi:hypothetical protein
LPFKRNPQRYTTGERETQEQRRARLRAAEDSIDWSTAEAIDEVVEMFGAALEEMKAMRGVSGAVGGAYTFNPAERPIA